jgi:hypothetical protein
MTVRNLMFCVAAQRRTDRMSVRGHPTVVTSVSESENHGHNEHTVAYRLKAGISDCGRPLLVNS